ncbi:MAG: hypothetical protein WBF17_07885, partial [Phycisphaerae bacterium]
MMAQRSLRHIGLLAAMAACGSAAAETATRHWAAPSVQKAAGAEGVIRFDLSALPRSAKVYRADLVIRRTAEITGRDDDALVDIEIRPLFEQVPAGGDPRAPAAPLALRAPWYDRLDATEAVRAWVSGRANGGFLVRTCPKWNAAATCLDVAW